MHQIQNFIAHRNGKKFLQKKNEFVLNPGKEKQIIEIKSIKLADFEWTKRTYNVLNQNQIKSIYDLVGFQRTELRALNNLGEKSLVEIEQFLKKNNLYYAKIWNRLKLE